MSTEDPMAPQLRKALRSLTEDTPSNDLARASILAAVAGSPLEAVARAEERRRLFGEMARAAIATAAEAARRGKGQP